jgi:hypothetical protein
MVGDVLQETLRRVLARETGDSVDSSATAAATSRLLEKLAQHLTIVVGELGVTALYGRSMYLVRRRLPWLQPASAVDSDGFFADLQTCMQQAEPMVATDGAVILLTTTVELLAALLGEGLTLHLLSGAWPHLADEVTLSPE